LWKRFQKKRSRRFSEEKKIGDDLSVGHWVKLPQYVCLKICGKCREIVFDGWVFSVGESPILEFQIGFDWNYVSILC